MGKGIVLFDEQKHWQSQCHPKPVPPEASATRSQCHPNSESRQSTLLELWPVSLNDATGLVQSDVKTCGTAAAYPSAKTITVLAMLPTSLIFQESPMIFNRILDSVVAASLLLLGSVTVQAASPA